MDDLASRKRELYRAYDEAALRILLDRCAEEEGERLLKELAQLPEAEKSAPEAEARAVEETLARCAGKKRAAIRRRAALRACGKVAAVLLVLGSLAGYASFTASAHQEQQAAAENAYSQPYEWDGEEQRAPDEEKREDQRDEIQKTAD